MKKIIPFILFLFFIKFSVAQDTTKYPIDIQLQACMDSTQNQTTLGMMDCEVRARDAWDKELNNYYNLLMKILTADEKAKLKTAQKNWLVYRDTEFSFSNTMYYDLQGTMWKITAAQREVEIVKTRALEIKTYYDTLTATH